MINEKRFFSKQFDELKHTINDSYLTLSALSALSLSLSRALLYVDSRINIL
jgi:hypothetical protein